jgi:hypothetical protein
MLSASQFACDEKDKSCREIPYDPASSRDAAYLAITAKKAVSRCPTPRWCT